MVMLLFGATPLEFGFGVAVAVGVGVGLLGSCVAVANGRRVVVSDDGAGVTPEAVGLLGVGVRVDCAPSFEGLIVEKPDRGATTSAAEGVGVAARPVVPAVGPPIGRKPLFVAGAPTGLETLAAGMGWGDDAAPGADTTGFGELVGTAVDV
ncbi:MAG: hypothetical protein HW416_52 [Chloroflexi bacterium]|nr:hypothetical protein [Chloroflexota bacterium]